MHHHQPTPLAGWRRLLLRRCYCCCCGGGGGAPLPWPLPRASPSVLLLAARSLLAPPLACERRAAMERGGGTTDRLTVARAICCLGWCVTLAGWRRAPAARWQVGAGALPEEGTAAAVLPG